MNLIDDIFEEECDDDCSCHDGDDDIDHDYLDNDDDSIPITLVNNQNFSPPTNAELDVAVEQVFAAYPGYKLSVPFVVGSAIGNLTVIRPMPLKHLDEHVRSFLHSGVDAGKYGIIKGKNGGIRRLADGNSPMPIGTQATAKQPERDCPTCSRKNDVGVSKCWNCEMSNPCPR